MSNLATRTYCPRTGSVPARAIAYFSKNRGARHTQAELAALLGVTTDGFASALTGALEAGFMYRSNGYYTAGDDIDEAPDYGSLSQTDVTIAQARTTPLNAFGVPIKPQASPLPPKRNTPAVATRHAVDFTTFKVDDDVPMHGTRLGKGGEKWAPLLNQLVKPGQSAVIDPVLKGAIYAACKARQSKGNGKYKTGFDLQGNTRIWRTE